MAVTAGYAPFDIAGTSSRRGARCSPPSARDLSLHRLVVDASRNEYGRCGWDRARPRLAPGGGCHAVHLGLVFLAGQEGLAVSPSQVWNSLAADSADIEAVCCSPSSPCLPDGLIEPRFRTRPIGSSQAAPRGSVSKHRAAPTLDYVVAATALGELRECAGVRRRDGAHRAPQKSTQEPCPMRDCQ